MPVRNPHGLVEPTPAARDKLVEKGTVKPVQHGRRAHRPAGAGGDCLRRSHIMPFSEQGQIATDFGKRRLSQHPARRGREYAVRMQQLARQVEPVSFRIFRQIVQYVGELQCTTRSPAGVSSPKMRIESRLTATARRSQ